MERVQVNPYLIVQLCFRFSYRTLQQSLFKKTRFNERGTLRKPLYKVDKLTGNDHVHIEGRPEEPPQVVTVKVLITQFSVTTFQVHLKIHEPYENSVRKSNKAMTSFLNFGF